MTAAVAKLTRAEAVERLTAAGAPVAPVLSHAGMLGLDHFRQRAVQEEGPVRTTVHPPLAEGPVAEPDEHRGQTWRSRTA